MPFRPSLALLLILLIPTPAHPYSVQTHQQIVDLIWIPSIQPILLGRYPHLTQTQLDLAHAYAYGGAAIQDLGYYPFGNQFFSNLTHYVRSGDFVLALIDNARNADELAFALGALTHYVGDLNGHALAVNPAVALEFPSLARRFGPSVSYEQDQHAHVRTEFAFDIDEIAHHRIAPLAYLRHIGLGVPTAQLARAFFDTYGLDELTVLGKRRPVLRGFRFAVRSFLPRIAYAETILHRHDMPADTPGPELDRLTAEIDRASTENNWAAYRRKPGLGTYSLAAVIFLLPKLGVLSGLALRGPIPATHDLYVESLNRTTTQLRTLLADFPHLTLPNRDLDTGDVIAPGTYRLADQTYAQLLNTVTRTPTQPIPPTLKHDLLAFYADPTLHLSTQDNPTEWAQVQANLIILATIRTTPQPSPMLEIEPVSAP